MTEMFSLKSKTEKNKRECTRYSIILDISYEELNEWEKKIDTDNPYSWNFVHPNDDKTIMSVRALKESAEQLNSELQGKMNDQLILFLKSMADIVLLNQTSRAEDIALQLELRKRSINISLNGIHMSMTKTIKPGTSIIIHIMSVYEGIPSVCSILGEVIREEKSGDGKKNYAGIKFNYRSNSEKEWIERLIRRQS